MALLSEVDTYARQHALFRPGDRVLVAVSGGPDSVALLHVLHRMQPSWQLQLHVVHVDHRLRAGAEEDAAFVRRLAGEWSVPVSVVSVDVKAARRGGESTQQAARRLRLAALRRVAREEGAEVIALGHHRDDQAETVLLRLLRGTGPTGLGGIRPRRGPFVRPLLDVSRTQIERYCQEHGLHVVHDPSNESDVYARNRIRRHLLPMLKDQYNRNVVERLARTAGLLQEDDTLLESMAKDLYSRARISRQEESPTESVDGARLNPVFLSIPVLQDGPPALVRRALRRALVDAGTDVRRLTYDHTDGVSRFVTDGRAGAMILPGNVRVERIDDELVFGLGERVEEGSPGRISTAVVLPEPPHESEIHIPGRTPLGAGFYVDVHLQPVTVLESSSPQQGGGEHILAEVQIDMDSVKLPLYIRTRRPGDRMRPVGLGGTKKLQDLFVDEKVPRAVRDNVPVIHDRDGIVWIPGLRMDEKAAPTIRSRNILYIAIMSL